MPAGDLTLTRAVGGAGSGSGRLGFSRWWAAVLTSLIVAVLVVGSLPAAPAAIAQPALPGQGLPPALPPSESPGEVPGPSDSSPAEPAAATEDSPADPGVALQQQAPADPVAADEVSARQQAEACGCRVEIASRRTETNTSYINADGSLSDEIAPGPIRVRQPDGSWVAIDETLQVTADGVRPVMTAVDLRLSAGGGTELVRLATPSGSLTVGWEAGVLPAPTLAGPVATYAAVAADTDLDVEARAVGFVKRVVVNARPQQQPVYRFRVALNGFTVTTSNRRINIVDAQARVVATADPPEMWSGAAQIEGRDAARRVPVAVRVTRQGGTALVELTPDLAFLQSPDVQLPIVIDPGVNLVANEDTGIAEFNQGGYHATTLGVGYHDGFAEFPSSCSGLPNPTYPDCYRSRRRALLRFNHTSVPTGANIVEARLWLYRSFGASASPRQLNAYRLTSGITTSSTWSNQPSAATTLYGAASPSVNGFFFIPVTAMVAEWTRATSPLPNFGVQVRAANETDRTYKMTLASIENADSGVRPYLEVIYGGRPLTPTRVAPADGGRVIGSPVLSAVYSDPDGEAGGIDVRVIDETAEPDQVVGPAWYWSGDGPSGRTASVTTSGLVAGRTYRWEARAWDGRIHSGSFAFMGRFRVNSPPGTPVTRSPASGARVAGTTALTAQYIDADGDPGGVDVRVFDSAGTRFGPEWYWSGDGPAGRDASVTVAGLARGQTYRWQARGWDGLQHSTAGFQDRGTFTVNRLPTATRLGPADAARVGATPTLSVRYGDGDGDPGRVDFRVFDAQGQPVAQGDWSPGGQWHASSDGPAEREVAYTLSHSLAPGSYTWDVRAFDGLELSEFSPRSSFVVDNAAPTLEDLRPPTGSRLPAAPEELSALYRDADGHPGTVAFSLSMVADGVVVEPPLGTATSASTASGQRATVTAAQLPVLAELLTGDYQFTAVATDSLGAVSATQTSVFSVAEDATVFGALQWSPYAGSVNTALGQVVHSETDQTVATAGPALTLERAYNSRDTRPAGGFGTGWSWTWGMRVVSAGGSAMAAVDWPDGRREVHTRNPDGSYKPPTGWYNTLARDGAGWSVTTKTRTVYRFDAAGRLTSVTDANGRVQTLSYDAAGQLDIVFEGPVLDGAQRYLDFTWTGGRITAVTTPPVDGASGPLQWVYRYHADTRLAQACDPRGPQVCTDYEYSGGRLTRVVAPEGNTRRAWTYDAAGAVLTQADGEGGVTRYDYAPNGSCQSGCVEVASPRAGEADVAGTWTTVQFYDSELRMVSERLPATGDVGAPTASVYGYDTSGNRSSVTDPLGHPATIAYDGRGNPTRTLNAEEEATASAYDGDLLRFQTDPRGTSDPGSPDAAFTTEYQYDEHRNLVAEISPPVPRPTGTLERLTRTWAYTTGGEPAVGSDGTMPTGLVASETDFNGLVTSHAYNRFGDRVRTITPTGLTTTWTYDGLGRRLSETVVDAPQGQPAVAAVTAVTQWAYDGAGNVTRTVEPAVVNAVTAATLQRATDTTWTLNGLAATVTVSDAAKPGAPARVTVHGYDAADRLVSLTDAIGGETVTVYDAAGNPVAVTDPAGRVTETDYDTRDQPVAVTRVAVDEDAASVTDMPRDIVITRTAYDGAGRATTQTDAEGRRTATVYDDADRVDTVTALDYHDTADPDDTRPQLFVDHDYDAAGNLVTVSAGRDGATWLRVTGHVYDALHRVTQTSVTGPDGFRRVSTWQRDRNGNPVREERLDAGADPPTEVTTWTYQADLPVTTTIAGAVGPGGEPVDLVTIRRFDQRGHVIAETDPRGHADPADPALAAAFTTATTFDTAGRESTRTAPPVAVTDATDATVTTNEVRPATATGYDAHGNPTHVRDPRGHVTVTIYDLLDRPVQQQWPAYQPPGGGAAITPVETTEYDPVGNPVAVTDRRGHTTTRGYDELDRLVTQTDPDPRSTPAEPITGGVWHWRYDRVGNRTFQSRPNGPPAALPQPPAPDDAQTTWAYDSQNRPIVTATEVSPVASRPGHPGTGVTHTDTMAYDVLGRMVRAVTAEGLVTIYRYNAADEQVAITRQIDDPGDDRGDVTTAQAWQHGRLTTVTDPLGRVTVERYDAAGRRLTVERLSPDGALLTRESWRYDGAGNPIAHTPPRGHDPDDAYDADTYEDVDPDDPYDDADPAHTAVMAVNAAGWTTQLTQPVSDAAAPIVSRYGHDAAGNLVTIADGRAANDDDLRYTTRYRYDPWGLQDRVVEPPTAATPTEADRTWTTTYDAGGLAVAEDRPGGVVVLRTFNAHGLVESEAGGGSDADAASRVFVYDQAGRQVLATHPAPGDVGMVYDDRDLLVHTSGPAGTSSFSWDGDARLAARSDLEGTPRQFTTAFAWSDLDELARVEEPLTATAVAYRFDAASQLVAVDYGGGGSRSRVWPWMTWAASPVTPWPTARACPRCRRSTAMTATATCACNRSPRRTPCLSPAARPLAAVMACTPTPITDQI